MNVEAYILVGGKSSRFGIDKSLAELGGTTMADRASAAVRLALPETPIYFIGAGGGGFADEADRLRIQLLPDEIQDRGPVGGLYTALKKAVSDWVFLFACDLPMMTGEFISRLLKECGDEVDAVLPEQPDGRLQPLCAYYRVSTVLPILSTVMDTESDAAMMTVIDHLKARVLKTAETKGFPSEIWTNVNRREDLDEIARKLSHSDSI